MANKFKVGDIVIGNDKADKIYGITKKGWIGKVVESYEYDKPDSIRVREYDGVGRTFCVDPDRFDLYIPREGKILIMVDEKDPNKIIARDLITKKTAEAKCNPKDEWDFSKGAKLALERLYPEKKEEEKPKYWNGKVVCVASSNNKYFTEGKIYTVKNGELFDNDPTLPHMRNIKNFKDINGCLWFFKFVEFKGEASHV